ncbi:MAG: tRNA pseudouridine(13) synthase TruD [Myxococcales bacterium]|nr:tRNA pseudouridine(13) synthase TruD [Myxococcales bacterium]
MHRLTANWPGSGGQLLSNPKDFDVEEVLPYSPSGQGQHVFFKVRKLRMDSLQAAVTVARALGVIGARDRLPPEAGLAGLKDRHAQAIQWISLPWPEDRPIPSPSSLATEQQASYGEQLELLRAVRHNHKLRKGHVAHNRFAITIRNVPPGGFQRALETLHRLQITGVPNAFGPQRFGINGQNPHQARAILNGQARKPRDRRLWSLLLSSLQSEIFNQLLKLRIQTGLFTTALAGDRMVKHVSGGQFLAEDPRLEQPRIDALEISPTGSLPGRKPPAGSTGIAAELEQLALQQCSLSEAWISRLGVGARRPLRFPLDPGAQLTPIRDLTNDSICAYRAEFVLPSGAYATVLLDELVKPENGPLCRVNDRRVE